MKTHHWMLDRIRRARSVAGAGALLALAAGLLGPDLATGQTEFRSSDTKFRSDPVENLRQVLNSRRRYEPFVSSQDKDYPIKLKAGLALFQKKLDEASGKDVLRTSADLSAALLLVEWDRDEQVLRSPEARRALGIRAGETARDARKRMSYHQFRDIVGRLFAQENSREGYSSRARALEFETRTKLTNRFVTAVKGSLESTDPIRQMAVCHLILETMGGAIEQIEEPLPLYDAIVAPFAGPLSSLAEGKGAASEEVRLAALKALGRFHTVADKVGPLYKAAVDPSEPAAVRLAAAEGLEGLIYSATGTERLRGSEPGVSVREVRRSNQALSRDVRLSVAAAVVPGAARGLGDRSAAIREQCAQALNHSANALFAEIRRSVPGVLVDPVLDEKPEIDLPVSELAPVMKAFAAEGDAILKAFTDADPKVRNETRRAAEALGRSYSLLQSVRKAKYSVIDSNAPPPLLKEPEFKEKKEPDPKDLGAARRRPSPVRLVRYRQELVKEKAPSSPKLLNESEAALGEMLKMLVEASITSTLKDTDARSRRAAAEAAESLGALAEPVIPRLVTALKDDDPFVRWIAARTLGNMAKLADQVVPALVANFNDDDLDARVAAIAAVAKYGPEASSAAEALGKRLGKGDTEVRIAVLKALDRIGNGAKEALPAIAGQFQHPDPRVRTGAAILVGKFEGASKSYVEALRKLLDDPDTEVRRAASGAILAIE